MIALLTTAGLLTADLAEGDTEYLALGTEAFGGIVWCGDEALLRSIVVADRARRTGKGRDIVDHLLSRARRKKVQAVWLLTETAEPFFAAMGFVRRARDDAPPAISATSQFRTLCPASAALMCLPLA
jgi:amino-acid N-acetyltransferase